MNADVDNCVFVKNATTGVNTVLRALRYEPGDVILHFDTIYGSCDMTVKYLEETTPVEGRRISITYPISDKDICKAFEDAIKQTKADGKRPKLAIFDTITSMPGLRVPFEELTSICRSHEILSCIDAAHCVGQIKIDLSKLDPDFFVSNCHKWLLVPRGCALFYVSTRNQHLLRSTLPTSVGFVPQPSGSDASVNPLPPSPNNPFVANFAYVGTLDNAPYLCVQASIEWRKKLSWKDLSGEEAIIAYNQDLARKAGELVAKRLNSELMENAEKTLTRCAMSNVRLPLSMKDIANGDTGTAVKVAQWMAKTILYEHNTFMAVFIHAGAWWVRLSGQIYLTLDDFEYAATVLTAICEGVRQGRWNSP